MIARYWSARASHENLQSYLQHFEESVMPELKGIPGFVRADLLTRTVASEVEIVVFTIWQSFGAIDAFAGTDREAAVVAPQAAALFTSYDRRVRHFDIALSA
jgi:heme-degrading monooxygenase HmoA